MEEKKEYQHSVSNADILLRESEFTDLIDKDNTNNDKTPMNMNLHYIILYYILLKMSSISGSPGSR